ncbi:hypothetical protein RCOM_1028550 [Ricinus communis]|uniref:RNase H type-1 domain-containing protein n=1 Tax=Ricinus communis TaxID=3988 RepID=B9SK80_RICCO|nr:hypothetical protein RCOM_1028550 [Ricinus communis]
MINWDWHIKVVHTYQEGNRCADLLANLSFDVDIGCHSLDAPPDPVQEIMIQDIQGVSFTRSVLVSNPVYKPLMLFGLFPYFLRKDYN